MKVDIVICGWKGYEGERGEREVRENKIQNTEDLRQDDRIQETEHKGHKTDRRKEKGGT
jgi:hypothetical protein